MRQCLRRGLVCSGCEPCHSRRLCRRPHASPRVVFFVRNAIERGLVVFVELLRGLLLLFGGLLLLRVAALAAVHALLRQSRCCDEGDARHGRNESPHVGSPRNASHDGGYASALRQKRGWNVRTVVIARLRLA